MNAFRFRCTACGNCCRDFRVAVTGHDLERLAQATGRAARDFVDWLEPDEVDMAGEPESFVELPAGRRLMVLRQRDGACALLGADGRCSAYSARPQDCRLFPFDVSGEAGTERRVSLLPLARCEAAFDADNDERALTEAADRRTRELLDYQASVARFNRSVRRKRRFGHATGGADAFLRSLSAREEPESSSSPAAPAHSRSKRIPCASGRSSP